MQKHVLIIGGMRAIHHEIRDLGARMSIICGVERVISRLSSEKGLYCRVVGVRNIEDVSEYVAIAQSIDKIDKIDAIGCYDEKFQLIASEIAEVLNLEYVDKETINIVNNKYKMREALRELGIDNLRYKKINSERELKEFLLECNSKIVLKPIDGTASNGVSIIEDEKDIQSAVQWFKTCAGDHQMYAEEFIEGKEYSVEAVSFNKKHTILAVTEKFKSEIHCVEVGHCIPADISEEEFECIRKYVGKILEGLSINNTVSHTELIITKNGPKVVETHIRPGGDNIPELLKLSQKDNLYNMAAKITLNMQPIDEFNLNKYERAAAIWYLCPAISGKFNEILNIEEMRQEENVHAIELYKSSGDEISTVSNSFDRLGSVIATGDTFVDAINNVRKIAETMEILVTTSM